MPRTVYALLVGIDQYQSPVNPLHGCVADIEAMHTFLASRVGGDDHQLDVVTLKNEEATREAIIENFLQHLGQAGPGDTALFCYNGHGSQQKTAPEFLHLEPDGLDETLVCYDSRLPGNYDLADKEISKLIAEVASKDPHVVLILDSCHSGSATRSVESLNVRRVPTDNRQRPVSSYFVSPSELQSLVQKRGVTETQSGWMGLPRGKHLVLSACQSDQEAKEIPIEGQTRGVFSFYLMETLQSTTGIWTYRDLFARVNSMVGALVSQQAPVIEATDFSDLDRPFLGGAVQSHTPYFTASFDDREGWVIDAGTIHGIPAVQPDDTTQLAIFAVDSIDLEATNQAIGSASVRDRQPTRSTIEMVLHNETEPDTFTIYKAIITSLPVAALGVSLEGDAGAVQLVRDALSGAASTQVRELDEGGELQLVASDEQYLIKRAADDRPLHAVIAGWSAEKAAEVVEHLEHIGRWIRIARLNNATSKLPPNAVTLECYSVEKNGELEPMGLAGKATDHRLFYEYRDEKWHEPTIKVKLTNNSQQRLYCMLFDLTDSFEISTEGLLPQGDAWLEPGQAVWAYNSEPIPASVPDEEWQNGMTEYKDLLKVVASTEPCDATRFEQDSLGIKYEPEATRSAAPGNSLEKLMQRSMTRKIGGKPGRRHEKSVDWTTAEFSITTVRPLEGTSMPGPGEERSLSPQVKVKGHSEMKANIRLTTIPLASRDMTQAPPLPTWLRDDPVHVQPFNLSPSRTVEAGLSVLELTDVSDYQAVTRAQPLTLQLDASLGPDESLLTIAYDPDGEFYLPLGRATRLNGGTEVRIERLPAPASGTRSLTSSIKIFFQKIKSEKLGHTFDYPLLGAADAQGNVNCDLDEVAARVTESSKILLYVHGITGDTRGMVESAFNPRPGLSQASLGDEYDLVLSFDYENLNTEIQSTARDLRQRLEQVGLGANHGKTLHIVAHSMGGLVSRWFIEHLGGNKAVQHLVMLGTPNGGSPWSSLEDWLVAAIGVGMNGLSTVAWPVSVLGNLMARFEEAAGATLAQMEKDSAFLQDLATSPDPGVRYSIIAGNTSLIAGALQTQGNEKTSRIHLLFEKLNLRSVLHATASLAFFDAPNDIAADVASITGTPGFEKLDPAREVACDHMTYFSTEAGLRALNDTLL